MREEMLKCNNKGDWQNRVVELSSVDVAYYKPGNLKLCAGRISLMCCSVSVSLGEKGQPMLLLKTPGRTYMFDTKSMGTRDEWAAAVRGAVAQCIEDTVSVDLNCRVFDVVKSTKMPGLGKARILQVDDGDILQYDGLGGLKYRRNMGVISAVKPSFADSRRLRLEFGQGESYEYTFASPVNRQNFLSLLRDVDAPGSLRIWAGSWNLGGALPFQSLAEWLCPDGAAGYDIVSVSAQECGSVGEQFLSAIASTLGSGFCLVASSVLWEIRMFVFAKVQTMPWVAEIETTTVATGVGGVMGNKGGAVVGFTVAGVPLMFVGCHLAARAERVSARNDNAREILSSVRFWGKSSEAVGAADFVWFMGDLNYRVETPWDEALTVISREAWDEYAEADQLNRERAQGRVLQHFEEGPLTFCPTYRYEKSSSGLPASMGSTPGGGPGWSNKRNQSPSWCDRILWCKPTQSSGRLMSYSRM